MDDWAQKFESAAKVIQNHDTLPEQFFDSRSVLRPIVREKLLMLADLIEKRFISLFPKVKIRDLLFCGSLCSYMYNESSDCDFFIVIDDIIPDDEFLNAKLAGELSGFLTKIAWKPSFYGHSVDFGVVPFSTLADIGILNNYSVLHDVWINKPVRQEYPFTLEELFRQYCRREAYLQSYTNSLEKTQDAFLTLESAQKLEEYLNTVRDNAFKAKIHSKEHEYSLSYNVYRLLKYFGVYHKFRSYVYDSRHHLKGENSRG